MNIINNPTFEFSDEDKSAFRTVRKCVEEYCTFFRNQSDSECEKCPKCLVDMIDDIEDTLNLSY